MIKYGDLKENEKLHVVYYKSEVGKAKSNLIDVK